MFQKFDGTTLDLATYIKQYLESHSCDVIYIGCDSKDRRKRTNYVTAICFHSNRGAHVIYEKETYQHIRKPDMRSRIWYEVESSKRIADQVTEILIDNDFDVDIYIHIDVSSDKGGSNNMINESIGFINSFGYECQAKPGAWAASFAADRFTD